MTDNPKDLGAALRDGFPDLEFGEKDIAWATQQIRYILEKYGDEKLEDTMVGAIIGYTHRIDRQWRAPRLERGMTPDQIQAYVAIYNALTPALDEIKSPGSPRAVVARLETVRELARPYLNEILLVPESDRH
jgi:hypothetical protein